MTSFDEAGSPGTHEPHGGGWRRAPPGVVVRAYIGGAWHDAEVADDNDLTGEIRVCWPPGDDQRTSAVRSHIILDASLYRPPEAGLPPPS